MSARANADLIDQKYAEWKQDPKLVDDTWAMFFEGFELGLTQPAPVGKNGAGSDPGAEQVGRLDLATRARVVSMVHTSIDRSGTQRPGLTRSKRKPPASRS